MNQEFPQMGVNDYPEMPQGQGMAQMPNNVPVQSPSLESPEMGGGIETTPPETESTPPTTESVNKNVENLLVERKEILSKTYEAKKERYKDNYLNKLMESLENNDKVKLIVNENDENVSDLNRKYNDDIKNMMNNIDNLLK
jgi:hypothetical protein